MVNAVTKILLWLTLSMFCQLAAGDDIKAEKQRIETLVRAYLATLDNDYPAQRRFYTPETRFTDPTSGQFGAAWDITGGDKIADFFESEGRKYGALGAEYRVEHLLIEPPFVVAHIKSTVTSCAVALGYPSKAYSGDIRLSMILEVDGDHITRRTDYADYSSAWDYLDAIKASLPARPDDPRCKRFKASAPD